MTENTITAVTALPEGYRAVAQFYDEGILKEIYGPVSLVALVVQECGVHYLTAERHPHGHVLTLEEWEEDFGAPAVVTVLTPGDDLTELSDAEPESFTGSLR